MALELHHTPKHRAADVLHSETHYQITEQLRYVRAILEMLEAGTWSVAAGMQLDTRLSAVDAAAGQLGWSDLRHALSDLRRELSACVQSDHAPDPAARAALHAAFARVLAIT
jgi:hypothetical protein